MRILASLFVVLTLSLLFVRKASADSSPTVVVVEIEGDIDDPEELRSAIGKELRAEVVTPDDPRAGAARGTLTIEARGEDRRISATYRSFGTPVARTVDLPSDPKRARSVAVLLAGNVAREEADELLNGLQKPAPTPSSEVARSSSDEQELLRLRAVLGELSATSSDRRRWVGIASLIEGGLSAGAGAYYMTREGDRYEYTRTAGLFLAIHGATSAAIGGLLLAGRSGDYEDLAADLETRAKTSAPADAVKAVEEKWAAEAASIRSTRKFIGWVGVVIGTLGIGTGLVLPAIAPTTQHDSGVPLASIGLVGLSGALVATGIHSIFMPTSIEQSWMTYRSMKGALAESARLRGGPSRPTVGLAPMAGGGMATFGFTF